MEHSKDAPIEASNGYFELNVTGIRSLVNKNLRRYMLAIIFLAISGYALSHLIEPKFRSVSIVASSGSGSAKEGIGAIASQLGPLTSLLGSGMFSSEDEQVTIAILRSRRFGNNFITKYGLLDEITGRSESELEALSDADLETVRWKAFKVFHNKLCSVTPDVRSGLIHISLKWPDRKEGARLNLAMINDLNQYLREVAISESKQSLEYLSSQLSNTTNAELRSAVMGLINEEMKVSMMANVREDYALKIIDPAVPAIRKSDPKRWIFLLYGLVIGMLITLGHLVYRLATERLILAK